MKVKRTLRTFTYNQEIGAISAHLQEGQAIERLSIDPRSLAVILTHELKGKTVDIPHDRKGKEKRYVSVEVLNPRRIYISFLNAEDIVFRSGNLFVSAYSDWDISGSAQEMETLLSNVPVLKELITEALEQMREELID